MQRRFASLFDSTIPSLIIIGSSLVSVYTFRQLIIFQPTIKRVSKLTKVEQSHALNSYSMNISQLLSIAHHLPNTSHIVWFQQPFADDSIDARMIRQYNNEAFAVL
jgi:hypothetical protein